MDDPTAACLFDMKCWVTFFEAMASGAKKFEIRRRGENEATPVAGDILLLREWWSNDDSAQQIKPPNDAAKTYGGMYTGRALLMKVTYCTTLGTLIDSGLDAIASAEMLGSSTCILSIEPVEPGLPFRFLA